MKVKVENDEQQQAIPKRKRVSKACDVCRLKKAKCDGLNPCTGCSLNKENCSYSESNKKRGIPSGYTKDLEAKNFILQLLLTKLFIENPSIEERITRLLDSSKLEFIEQINTLKEVWDNDSQVKYLIAKFIEDDFTKLNIDLKSTSSRSNSLTISKETPIKNEFNESRTRNIIPNNRQNFDLRHSQIPQHHQQQNSFIPYNLIPNSQVPYNENFQSPTPPIVSSTSQQYQTPLQMKQINMSYMNVGDNNQNITTPTSSVPNLPNDQYPVNNYSINSQFFYVNNQNQNQNQHQNQSQESQNSQGTQVSNNDVLNGLKPQSELSNGGNNTHLNDNFSGRSERVEQVQPQYLNEFIEDERKRF